jgi:Phage integrase, N-terminal SAM-like domain
MSTSPSASRGGCGTRSGATARASTRSAWAVRGSSRTGRPRAALLAGAPSTKRPRRTGRVTLREAADEWLRYEEHEAKVKRSTVMDYRNCADRLCRELGEMPLEDITPRVIERWKAGFRAERRLADGGLRRTAASTRTIRKYLINLNGIFRRARGLRDHHEPARRGQASGAHQNASHAQERRLPRAARGARARGGLRR